MNQLRLLSGGTVDLLLDHPAMKLFIQTIQQQIGRKMEIKGGLGSHDGRHFNELGVPFLMTKPEGGNIHGDNEHIDIDSTMIFY